MPAFGLLRPCEAAAQDITVEESAGPTAAGAKATVAFQTTTGERVVVRRVLQQMTAQTIANYGYQASAFGDVSTDLCFTSCKLTLPAGYYKIRFGEYNPMNANTPLDLNIPSCASSYMAEPFSGGKFIAGFLMTILGGTAAIVGTTMAGLDDDGRVSYAVLAGVGIG